MAPSSRVTDKVTATMLDKFWEAAGSKLADRWAEVGVPALVFWLGGLLAWLWSHGGFSALRQPAGWLGKQQVPAQVVVILGLLIGVAASGVVIRRMTTPVLQLIEGYWPAFLRPLRDWRIDQIRDKAERTEDRWQSLQESVQNGTATAGERAESVRADRRLRRLPSDGDYLPTRVGNILRAAENRPTAKYGLNAPAIWPHLWLLLPEATRTELSQARASLDTAVAACIWSLAFVCFTPWAWWAAPVGIGISLVAYLFWVPARSEVYADLVEAAFDLHRTVLYTQLRWPLPANPADELSCGKRVSTYLLRGLSGTSPTFTQPAESPSEAKHEPVSRS
jgi:hypothetical protein